MSKFENFNSLKMYLIKGNYKRIMFELCMTQIDTSGSN